MDNDFHPPLRDPRMLRLGRIFKQRWLPPAYLMDQTVQFLKESARCDIITQVDAI